MMTEGFDKIKSIVRRNPDGSRDEDNELRVPGAPNRKAGRSRNLKVRPSPRTQNIRKANESDWASYDPENDESSDESITKKEWGLCALLVLILLTICACLFFLIFVTLHRRSPSVEITYEKIVECPEKLEEKKDGGWCQILETTHNESDSDDSVPKSDSKKKNWFAKMAAKVGIVKKPQLKGKIIKFEDAKEIGLYVWDRMANRAHKEIMPIKVKRALRMAYGSSIGKKFITSNMAQDWTKFFSKKEQSKFDKPDSVNRIKPFIETYMIDENEMEKPVSAYKTFNDFFSRGLKPECRPIAEPKNNRVAVSAADARVSAFESISDATKFWIKGKKFTLASFFGKRKLLAREFRGGSMVIFRLAPQDYHRFHWSVSGRLKSTTPVDGALYTVNPIAVNNPAVNVFTENKRYVCEIDSPEFGKVVSVAVGAAMVGSINFYKEQDADITKGEQHGEMRFGGSTVVYLFKKGAIKFSRDILMNSCGMNPEWQRPIETYCQVNTKIGEAPSNRSGMCGKSN